MFEERQRQHNYRVLTIRWADGLQFGSGFTKPADQFCCVFLLYPMEALLPGDAIREQTIDWLWESIYGANWRLGNEDGSRYTILVPPEVHYPDRAFTTRIAISGKLQIANQTEDNLWFYRLQPLGEMNKLTSEQFLELLPHCQFPLSAAS